VDQCFDIFFEILHIIWSNVPFRLKRQIYFTGNTVRALYNLNGLFSLIYGKSVLSIFFLIVTSGGSKTWPNVSVIVKLDAASETYPRRCFESWLYSECQIYFLLMTLCGMFTLNVNAMLVQNTRKLFKVKFEIAEIVLFLWWCIFSLEHQRKVQGVIVVVYHE